jgi:hypothetical protein
LQFTVPATADPAVARQADELVVVTPITMRRMMSRAIRLLSVVGILAAAATHGASAQPAVSLTGTYRCVQNCDPQLTGRSTYVTQNGWDINIANDAGVSVRGWIDWFSPTRIWMESLNQGAVYSADGTTIQFDRGTVFARYTEPDPTVIAYCARRYRTYDPTTQTYLGRGYVRRPCP